MAKHRGQGQSHDSTEMKERGIASAISINLRIFKSKYKPWATYQHFDLNAGSGMNDQVNCIGSPLAFIQSVDNLGISNYRAYFTDIDHDTIEKLHTYPEMKRENCFLFHGDNESLITAIPDLIRLTDKKLKYAIGSVLVDPNGSEVNVDALSWLSKQCPRLDFIINWNSVIFKRLQGAHGTLCSAIKSLDKKHWLIRKPSGGHQFILIVGRNMRIGEDKKNGFYHLNSDLGQEIFHTCNLTKAEDKKRIESFYQSELVF